MTNTPPDPDAPFARWLRERMAVRGLTLEDLAAAAGVAPTTVSWWVNGRACPQWDGFVRVAAALGADPAAAPPCRRRVRT